MLCVSNFTGLRVNQSANVAVNHANRYKLNIIPLALNSSIIKNKSMYYQFEIIPIFCNLVLSRNISNASNEMSTEQILTAYGAAVATSCGLAVGLGQWVRSI
jgi:hypothetical protein